MTLGLIPRRISYSLTAAVILAYFLFFTWKSLFIYFDQDDMYNLYMAWNKPLGQVVRANFLFWNGFFRPLGAIFYRGIFAAAGFNPLPFHLAALALGIANTALCFWFTRLISRSDRIAALATLLFAFHTRLMEVWFRTSVVYDVLCFTFVYLAACLYIAGRGGGREPGFGRIAAILLCFVCALDAKEMAVCLPVFLLGYELLFNTANLKAFLRSRAFVLIAVLGIMTVFYTIGKLHGPDSMVNNPLYRPEYSVARFVETWGIYLRHLFVVEQDLKAWVSITILSVLLGVALAARSRQLIFAWIVIFFGLLPVSFAPGRGAFVLYISYVGWTLYAAIVLVALQNLIVRSHPQYRTALACLVFGIVGWRYGKFNLHDQRADPRHWLFDGPVIVHAMADQMLALHPAFPPHARMLFLEDAFSNEEWTPLFIIELLYEDSGMTVDRVKIMTPKPAGWDDYRYVFTYEGGEYKQLKPAGHRLQPLNSRLPGLL